MRIYKLANIIAIPFFVVLLILGYLAYLDPISNYLAWVIAPLTCLILIYLFSPQINYWWLSKNPVELDKTVKDMLLRTNPVYGKLSLEEQTEFDNRLVLYTEAKEFIGKGFEEDNKDVPYDIRNLISQVPVTMTLNRADYQWKNYERIVFYKHPFPSPRFKFLHTAETEAEDGVVILSLEHVEKALFYKDDYYDVAWHAFAEAFIKDHPKEAYPNLPADIWDSINRISPLNKEQIHATLGYKIVDALPVLINLYFNYRTTFKKELPELAAYFQSLFNTKTA